MPSDEELLRAELLALQNPTDCQTARVFLILPFNAGAGAHLEFFAGSLALALKANRTLIQMPHFWYYKDCHGWNGLCDCERHALGCFVQELSRCLPNLYPEHTCSFWSELDATDPCVLMQRGPTPSPVYMKERGAWMRPDDSSAIPERWRHRSREWFFGQLTGFLLSPTLFTLDLLDRRRAELGMAPWQRPMVGLHIRHGDKPSEGGPVLPLSRYLEQAEDIYAELANETRCDLPPGPSLVDTSGRSTLLYTFLSTDDHGEGARPRCDPAHVSRLLRPAISASVSATLVADRRADGSEAAPEALAAAAHNRSHPNHTRVFIFDIDRHLMPQQPTANSLVRVLFGRADEERRRYLESLYLDWLTLAEGDGFVGTLSSNFGCVAYLLGVYIKSNRRAWARGHAASEAARAPLAESQAFFYSLRGLALLEPRRGTDSMDAARLVGNATVALEQPPSRADLLRLAAESPASDVRARLAKVAAPYAGTASSSPSSPTPGAAEADECPAHGFSDFSLSDEDGGFKVRSLHDAHCNLLGVPTRPAKAAPQKNR
jgi:hypothetical protein